MKAYESKPSPAELPEDARELIRIEVSGGLERLRSSGFEERLRARLGSAGRPAGRASWRWAPVTAAAAALVLVGAAILWFGRAPRPGSPALVSALGELPGFQALERVPRDRAGRAGSSPSALSPFLRPLAAAAAERAAGDARPAEPPLAEPHYTLQQKIEILIQEKPIERALKSIKSNLGEV
jgi:hypothetical protein